MCKVEPSARWKWKRWANTFIYYRGFHEGEGQSLVTPYRAALHLKYNYIPPPPQPLQSWLLAHTVFNHRVMTLRLSSLVWHSRAFEANTQLDIPGSPLYPLLNLSIPSQYRTSTTSTTQSAVQIPDFFFWLTPQRDQPALRLRGRLYSQAVWPYCLPCVFTAVRREVW